MSSAQRSEGLCSKTFCSRCIRSEQRTISGAAWTQHYLQMQINLKTIATDKQTKVGEQQIKSIWVACSAKSCGDAALDTIGDTIGPQLLVCRWHSKSNPWPSSDSSDSNIIPYQIFFLPNGQLILSNIIKTNQRRFERVFNRVKGWQEAFDIAIVTYHAHCQRHIRRGCWERICNQAVVVKPGPTNLRDGRHSHSPRPSAKGKGHRRTKQC